MQDPDLYLDELGIAVTGWMDANDAPAVLDPAHRSLLNREAFFFADLGAKRTFDADPVHHCGLLTDPVSGERFRPADDSPSLDHNGRPFFFASSATLDTFAAAPDSFYLPRLRMLPKEGMERGGMEEDAPGDGAPSGDGTG